jgi:Cu/Ag efflux pump CusA
MLVVEKFPDADTLEVTRDVEQALTALAPGLGGVKVDTTVFRPATFIEEAVANLSVAVGAALLLGAFALFVLLRGWRPALIAVISIVVTMMVALLVLYALGGTINAIVVAGLMLGAIVVVDDAIVGVEAVVRRLGHPTVSDTGTSARAMLIAAILEVRGGSAYAWLIVLLAIVPLFLLTGVAGAFLPPLLIAYLIATVASMVIALTVTPALASLLLSEAQRPSRVLGVTKRVTGAYRTLLASVMARSRAVFAAVAVVTIAVVALAGASVSGASGASFVPPFKEHGLLIAVDGAAGTSNDETGRIAARAGAELRTIPGITNVGGHVGRAVTGDQVVGVNAGELWISIDPAVDYDSTIAAIQDVLAGYPGLALKLQTYTSERIDSVLAAPEDDVVVRVYGQDASTLRAKGAEVASALAGVDGLTAVGMEAQVDEPTLQIKVDLAATEKYGLRPGDVRRASTTLLSGLEVGLIFEEQKVFEVVVWGIPELRQSLSTIRDLPIRAADGSYVRLGDVARVDIGASPSVIKREGVFRYVDVGATVSGRDLNAVLGDVHSRVASIEFPFEYRAEVIGAAVAQQATLTRVIIVAAAAIIGVLLLFQAAFVSWRRAVVLLVTLPAAMIGAVVGGLLVGGLVSIGVIAGFVAVLAIAVRHGILMVGRYQGLEREPGAQFDPELILNGAEDRLAPVLTTAAVVALVVAPFVVLGSAPGLEILRPMAIVVLGGVATSTLFALFVVPAVIFRTGPSSAPEMEQQPIEHPGLSPA